MTRLTVVYGAAILLLYVATSVNAIYCFDADQEEILFCTDSVQTCYYKGDPMTKKLKAAGCGDDSDFCVDDGSTTTQCIDGADGTKTCCCHQELCNKGFV